jgi:DNA-binding CsgD family transcriptional regulator
LDADRLPIYQQIAAKALHLKQLGMSCSAIARRLSVTDKTVAKALRWLRRILRGPDR